MRYNVRTCMKTHKVGDTLIIQGVSFRITNLTLALNKLPQVELTSLMEELQQ